MLKFTAAGTKSPLFVNPEKITMVGEMIDASTRGIVIGQAMILVEGAQIAVEGSPSGIAEQIQEALWGVLAPPGETLERVEASDLA